MHRIKRENPNTLGYWAHQTAECDFLEVNFEHSPGELPFYIMRHLGHGDSVLDVGCGSGMVLRHIKAQRPSNFYAGCDFNPAAVDWCRDKIPLNRAFVHDLRSGERISPGHAYSLVMCTEVIEHLDRPADAVFKLVNSSTRLVAITTPYQNTGSPAEHVWHFDCQDHFDLLSQFGHVEITVVNGGSTILSVLTLSVHA